MRLWKYVGYSTRVSTSNE